MIKKVTISLSSGVKIHFLVTNVFFYVRLMYICTLLDHKSFAANSETDVLSIKVNGRVLKTCSSFTHTDCAAARLCVLILSMGTLPPGGVIFLGTGLSLCKNMNFLNSVHQRYKPNKINCICVFFSIQLLGTYIRETSAYITANSYLPCSRFTAIHDHPATRCQSTDIRYTRAMAVWIYVWCLQNISQSFKICINYPIHIQYYIHCMDFQSIQL